MQAWARVGIETFMVGEFRWVAVSEDRARGRRGFQEVESVARKPAGRTSGAD